MVSQEQDRFGLPLRTKGRQSFTYEAPGSDVQTVLAELDPGGLGSCRGNTRGLRSTSRPPFPNQTSAPAPLGPKHPGPRAQAACASSLLPLLQFKRGAGGCEDTYTGVRDF